MRLFFPSFSIFKEIVKLSGITRKTIHNEYKMKKRTKQYILIAGCN